MIVPAGKTLTIAAGVDCRFMQGGTYLDVSGELRAEGTSTDFIRFMPHVTGQHWQAVILRSGSTARLRYCDLIGGGSAMLVVQDATDVLVVTTRSLRYSIGEGMSGLTRRGRPQHADRDELRSREQRRDGMQPETSSLAALST